MSKFIRKLLIFAAFLGVSTLAASLMETSTASAAYCGVHTGRHTSMAGLVLELNWVPYGSYSRQATGVNGRVYNNDGRYDSDGYGNIIKLRSNNTYSVPPSYHSNDLTFGQYSSGCGDGYNVVLGYTATSSSTNGIPGPWALDCDASQYGIGNERIFTALGTGVPTGARAGGWWSTTTFRAVNGYTVYTSSTYYEPAPPNWTLSSTTTADKTTVYAGQSVTFTHTIRNSNEGGTASFQYGARYNYDGGAQNNYPSASNNTGSLSPNGTLNFTHTLTIPSDTTAGQVCESVVYYQRAYNNASWGGSVQQCVTIIRPQIVCSSSLGLNPGSPEPGMVITLTPGLTFSNPSEASTVSAGSNFYIRVVDRSTGSTIYNNSSHTKNLSAGTVTATSGNVTPNSGGYYDVSWGLSGSYGNYDCTGTFLAAYHPYFVGLGGDLKAGGSYIDGTTCNQDTNAVIRSWNNDSYPFFGAATEIAAFALGDISHFATGTDPSTGASTVGLGNNLNSNLAFANTTSPIGKFGSIPCMPDYFGQAMSQPHVIAPNTSVSSWSSGVYYADDDFDINGTTLPRNGQNVVLVVEGTATIKGDIRYDASGGSASADVAKMPRFTLIARGNIYIDKGVTELHGAYIAQPYESSGSLIKGNIYTCVSGSTVTSDYNLCNQPLRVYGSFSAASVSMSRSYGTLNTKTPAETFQYTPELWMGGIKSFTGTNTKYDSITSLPPTL